MEKFVRAGVGVLVFNRYQEILVGVRKGSHGAGKLSFPGGHIDFEDETMFSTSEREVAEETGIVCKCFPADNIRPELTTTLKTLSADGTKRYITVYLLADYVSGGDHPLIDGKLDEKKVTPKEPDKCEMWHWKSLQELTEMVGKGGTDWIPLPSITEYFYERYRKSNRLVP